MWTSKIQKFYHDGEFLVVSINGNVMIGQLAARKGDLVVLKMRPFVQGSKEEVKPTDPAQSLLEKANQSHGQ